MNLVRKYIFKTGIKYGLTGGVILGFFYFMLHLTESNVLAPGLVFLVSLLAILLIFFSIYEYNQIDAAPAFWKNMSVSMVNFLAIAVIYALIMILILYHVQPDIFKSYIQDRLAMMEENKSGYIENFSEEHYDMVFEEVKNTSRLELALDAPIKISILGLFSSILISLIYLLIKKKNNFNT